MYTRLLTLAAPRPSDSTASRGTASVSSLSVVAASGSDMNVLMLFDAVVVARGCRVKASVEARRATKTKEDFIVDLLEMTIGISENGEAGSPIKT